MGLGALQKEFERKQKSSALVQSAVYHIAKKSQ